MKISPVFAVSLFLLNCSSQAFALKKKFYLSVIIALVLMSPCAILAKMQGGQWIIFHDSEITGQVIDAETKRPIEGAVVVMILSLTQIASEGFGGYAKIIETATDLDGKFTVPGWISFKPWRFDSVTHEMGPKIVVYKPGYRVFSTHLKRDATMSRKALGTVDYLNNINPVQITKLCNRREFEENFENTKNALELYMIGAGLSRDDLKLSLRALHESESYSESK